MQIEKNIAATLRHRMEAEKKSKLEFSKELGIPRSTFQGYLKGENCLRSDSIEEIAKGLNITPAQLISGPEDAAAESLRLETRSPGAIRVGGHDLREFTCDSLLCNISMVFQNVYLFHDTIRANILFGKPDATEEEMIEAAKKARCHDFIMALPDGYVTVVGKGGGTLSGGEKQRISIARMMLKNAPIVILDEATASIDPENEHLIQQAISELTRGKTIITIAHRLATIQNADQILVVADGRIAEHGTHAELVQQDGLYRRFTAIREQAEGWRIAAE